MLREIRDLYLQTRKSGEHPWTAYMTRPFAAAVVYVLKDTRITPNQVTLAAFATSLVGAAVIIGWTSWLGLIVGALIYQLAYVLDCVDGQLARVRQIASPVGHLLDFMMDEAKAKLFFGAVAVRLYLIHDDPRYALVGVGGVAMISIALSLTTFMRRPEYLEAIGATPAPSPAPDAPAPDAPKPSLVRRLVGAVEWVAKALINYPTYVPLLALIDQIEVYLWVYIAVYALYTARAFAQIALRLGRFAPRG